MESLSLALISLIVQTPIVLVWTIGIILSLLRWRRHPAISIFTLIALIGFLVTSLVNTYLNVNLPFLLQEKGYSLVQIGSINAIRNIISVLIETCLWILIMISIFGWREKSNISG